MTLFNVVILGQKSLFAVILGHYLW
jgi:hypothetical protein